MNNQFSGPNAWHDYLTALEQATPVIEAVAVTDYYVTDTYEEMLRQGRRPTAQRQAGFSERGAPARRRDGERWLRQSPPASILRLGRCGELNMRLEQ
jgi:hypothetical protein